MSAQRVRWTYEEFAKLPTPGKRTEIIADELYISPVQPPSHQRVVVKVVCLLEPFVRDNSLGEVIMGPIDVLFQDGDFVQPDLVFVRSDRAHIISERAIEAAPDLIVEVVSDSTAALDYQLKRDRYALFGVPLYWVVDVDLRQIEGYRLAENPYEPVEIATDTLVWQPVEGGPALTLSVPHIVGA